MKEKSFSHYVPISRRSQTIFNSNARSCANIFLYVYVSVILDFLDFFLFPRLWFCRDGNGWASTERYKSDETGLGRGDKIGEATSQPMNFNHPLHSVSYHIGILTFQDFIFSTYTYYCQHLLQRLKMNAIQPLPSIGRYLQQCVHL